MRWNNPKLDPKPAANGNYYIKWNEYCERRQRFISQKLSTRTKTRAAAEAVFKGWLKAGGPEARIVADPGDVGANLTVADVLDDYLARCVSPDARRQNTSILAPARAALGDLPALDVQRGLDDYLLAREAAEIKSGTRRRECAAIMAAFRWAAGTRAKPKNRTPSIPASAVPEIELPEDSPARVVYLTLAQEAVHKAEAKAWEGNPAVYIFTMLGLHAGPRAEAICDLTWDRVDFEANGGVGSIDYRNPDRRVTKKRRSKVPMSPTIKQMLLEWRLRQGNGGRGVVVGKATHQAYDRWRKKSAHPWASSHVLRHTYASLALQTKQATLWEVAKVLADDYKTVEKTYGHAGELAHAVR